MNIELSRGSHFFGNLGGFGVPSVSIHSDSSQPVDWQWLAEQNGVPPGLDCVRCVETPQGCT